MGSDRWDELERLAREALDAAEAPCSTCGSDIGPGADAFIAAAHPQVILDLVGEVRVVTESRERGCACGDDDVCSFVAERDALRAEVERLRKAEADWEAHDARECPGDQHCDTHCPGGEL